MKKYIIPLLACILSAGCTENNAVSTGESAKEYLELWMAQWNEKNGKDIKPTNLGMYILEDTPGTGEVRSADSTWVYALFTIRSLGGKISSTDDEDLSKQLGTYIEGAWYGPKYTVTGEGYNYAGLDALLDGMKLGGTRRAIIPAWLLTTSRYSTMASYLEACTNSTHLDYTVTLVDQTTNISRHQAARIAEYMDAFYPGATSEAISEDDTDNGCFWFLSTYTPEGAEEREETASMRINYTGLRLDGQIFDTTIKKTAIDAGIDNSSKTYSPLDVTFTSSWSDLSIGGSTSFVDGFKAAVWRMKYAGEKAVVAFSSDYGYTSSSKGDFIPAYCPLVFELELLAAEEE